MGAINFSLHPELARLIRDSLQIRVFVETGTFRGDTAQAMLPLFEKIITVELSEDLARDAAQRFSAESTIKVVQGSSPEALSALCPELGGTPTLFWLDAHWCSADATAGSKSQCPLLDELAAIGNLAEDSMILIDDARLFLTVPPPPHEISNWPTFDSLVRRIHQVAPKHELSVINDMIVVCPPKARTALEGYARHFGHDLLRMASDAKDKNELARCHKEAREYAESLEKACQERLQVIEELSARNQTLESELAELKKINDQKNSWWLEKLFSKRK